MPTRTDNDWHPSDTILVMQEEIDELRDIIEQAILALRNDSYKSRVSNALAVLDGFGSSE